MENINQENWPGLEGLKADIEQIMGARDAISDLVKLRDSIFSFKEFKDADVGGLSEAFKLFYRELMILKAEQDKIKKEVKIGEYDIRMLGEKISDLKKYKEEHRKIYNLFINADLRENQEIDILEGDFNLDLALSGFIERVTTKVEELENSNSNLKLNIENLKKNKETISLLVNRIKDKNINFSNTSELQVSDNGDNLIKVIDEILSGTIEGINSRHKIASQLNEYREAFSVELTNKSNQIIESITSDNLDGAVEAMYTGLISLNRSCLDFLGSDENRSSEDLQNLVIELIDISKTTRQLLEQNRQEKIQQTKDIGQSLASVGIKTENSELSSKYPADDPVALVKQLVQDLQLRNLQLKSYGRVSEVGSLSNPSRIKFRFDNELRKTIRSPLNNLYTAIGSYRKGLEALKNDAMISRIRVHPDAQVLAEDITRLCSNLLTDLTVLNDIVSEVKTSGEFELSFAEPLKLAREMAKLNEDIFKARVTFAKFVFMNFVKPSLSEMFALHQFIVIGLPCEYPEEYKSIDHTIVKTLEDTLGTLGKALLDLGIKPLEIKLYDNYHDIRNFGFSVRAVENNFQNVGNVEQITATSIMRFDSWGFNNFYTGESFESDIVIRINAAK